MIEAPGLPEKIAADGHWVSHHTDGNGVGTWRYSDAVAVQVIIDAYTLAESAAHVCRMVDEHAREEFNRHTSAFAPGEMAGWAIMREEALAFQANALAACPNLTLEASARGCQVADIAARVLANAAALQALRAAIMGTAGRHKDAVRALTSFADINAYNWRTGWPA